MTKTQDKPIAWGEYPTIAKHPQHPEALRLVRHPNGPAIIHGPFLCTVGHFIRDVGEKLGPIEAGDYAEWVAGVLAGAAQDIAAQFAELTRELDDSHAGYAQWKALALETSELRDKALADLAEAKADAERAKAERNREHVHTDRARRQADRLAALLRYALPFIQHCNDCGSYRDSDAAPLMGRIDVALAEYGLPNPEVSGPPSGGSTAPRC